MASTVYIMEGANLFCGDHDPENSKHLTLEEMKLPDMQGIYVDHHPGGAPGAMEVEVGFQKLEPTFKLKGFDMPLLRQFGAGSQNKFVYTAYGAVRDKRTGRLFEAKSIFEARLGRITSDAYSRGNTLSHDYALNEVTHYQLWFDGAEEIYWDFFTNTFRTGGVDQNADLNRILRVPGSSV